MDYKAIKMAVNMLHLANNAPAALSLAAIPTLFALWQIGGGTISISFNYAALMVVVAFFLLAALTIKLFNYALLLGIYVGLARVPHHRFFVEGNSAKVKARVTRYFAERKLDFFGIDVFSQGERAILGVLRELLKTNGPTIIVCKKPFLLVKLEQRVFSAGEKGDETLVSILLDGDDVAATTFGKYLECVLGTSDEKVCKTPEELAPGVWHI
ncbi:MAG: hypothetical protein WC792_01035 [Candidatus Micrarchaeia archaeon]|jgi:hypothetical protein